jgi:hypothetical protein
LLLIAVCELIASNHIGKGKQDRYDKLKEEEDKEGTTLERISPRISNYFTVKVASPINCRQKAGKAIKKPKDFLDPRRKPLGVRKQKGKMQESRRNKDHRDPEDIPPKASKLRVRGEDKSSPLHIP